MLCLSKLSVSFWWLCILKHYVQKPCLYKIFKSFMIDFKELSSCIFPFSSNLFLFLFPHVIYLTFSSLSFCLAWHVMWYYPFLFIFFCIINCGFIFFFVIFSNFFLTYIFPITFYSWIFIVCSFLFPFSELFSFNFIPYFLLVLSSFIHILFPSTSYRCSF